MSNLLTIVTVTYNSGFLIEQFLKDLELPELLVGVVVVDSGSEDRDLVAEVSGKHNVQFLGLPSNVGYGAGSNAGSERSTSDWLAFVNPDVSVPAASLIELVRIAERNGIDCIGPSLLTRDGQSTKTVRPLIRPFWRRRGGHSLARPGQEVTLAASMSGCCMLVRREVFEAVGGFDARFFMFCEEIDLHARIADMGGRLGVARDVLATTDGGGSSSGVGRRWSETQRDASHVVYTFKHFGRVAGSVDLVHRVARTLIRPEFRPHRESMRQLFAEILRARTRTRSIQSRPERSK